MFCNLQNCDKNWTLSNCPALLLLVTKLCKNSLFNLLMLQPSFCLFSFFSNNNLMELLETSN